MRKLFILTCLWMFCCNAGLYSGRFNTTGVYTGDLQQETTIVTVYNTSAVFKAIAADSDTRYRIAYGTASGTLTSYSTDDLSTGTADVVSVTLTGLTPGQKYYYKAQYTSAADTGWASPTTMTPTDYSTFPRYFRIPPNKDASSFSFRAVIISDAHFSTYSAGSHYPEIIKPRLEGTYTPYETAGGISNGIKALAPDMVIFTGDDIQLEWAAADAATGAGAGYTAADTTTKAMYGAFLLALADLGIPVYFAPGNHELDFGGRWQYTCYESHSSTRDAGCAWDDPADTGEKNGQCQCASGDSTADCTDIITNLNAYTGFIDYRKSYLVHPATDRADEGRYSYVDWGGARLFFLTPYAYRSQDNIISNMCPFDLGAMQSAFYNEKVRTHAGVWNLVFIHQGLKGRVNVGCDVNTYGWGNVEDGAGNIYADLGCNASQLYKPLIRYQQAPFCKYPSFLFVGHSHYYAREVWRGTPIYTLPAPFRNASEDAMYYYGAYNDSTHVAKGDIDASPAGTAGLVVDVTAQQVKVWGMTAAGGVFAGIPEDTYSISN